MWGHKQDNKSSPNKTNRIPTDGKIVPNYKNFNWYYALSSKCFSLVAFKIISKIIVKQNACFDGVQKNLTKRF